MFSCQVGYFLRRNAAMYPDRLAVICKDTRFTYHELNQMANRLANYLLSCGIKKGDRIAYLFRNGVESVLCWWASQKIGAVAVPVNTNLLEDEIASILNEVRCSALIYHESFSGMAVWLSERCRSLRALIRRTPHSTARDGLSTIIQRGSAEEPGLAVNAEDESLILFTSGTLGRPKAVMRTQQMVREYALMMAVENGRRDQPETAITHMRLFHTGGWLNMMRMAVLAGTLVLLDNIEPEEVFSQIERYRATQIFMMPPVMYQRLFNWGQWMRFDRSSIRDVFCSGGRCSYEYAMSMFEMFPNAVLRFSWGSTEMCTPTGVALTREQVTAQPELTSTCGRLNTGCEVRLVDESGLGVPDGVVGEALVRSSMVASGYLNRPELSTGTFDQDGWFHTGDMLKRSPEGYYFLLDRKKDMIKTGGENVYAQEVECVLRDHPAIADCAVVGIPDRKFGEAVAVAIVLRPGAVLEGKELQQFCKARMASYRKPVYWTFLDHLPVNSINKVQKSVLRAHANELFTPIKDEV